RNIAASSTHLIGSVWEIARGASGLLRCSQLSIESGSPWLMLFGGTTDNDLGARVRRDGATSAAERSVPLPVGRSTPGRRRAGGHSAAVGGGRPAGSVPVAPDRGRPNCPERSPGEAGRGCRGWDRGPAG